ncbi:hypothetical protein [Crocosphaera sp.]
MTSGVSQLSSIEILVSSPRFLLTNSVI